MNISNEKEVKPKVQNNSFVNHLKSQDEEYDQSDIIYGRKLQSPILGYNYQLPNLSTNYVPVTTLDTSLLHIPIYTHLKIYDLKPVQLPETPSILSTLHLQFLEDTAFSKSSREMSTARLSEESKIAALHSARDSTKLVHKK